jgi:hypothetical protein
MSSVLTERQAEDAEGFLEELNNTESFTTPVPADA